MVSYLICCKKTDTSKNKAPSYLFFWDNEKLERKSKKTILLDWGYIYFCKRLCKISWPFEFQNDNIIQYALHLSTLYLTMNVFKIHTKCNTPPGNKYFTITHFKICNKSQTLERILWQEKCRPFSYIPPT